MNGTSALTQRQRKALVRALHKWLGKGNMSRALRDVLPPSGLGPDERQEVAALVHGVVRYWRWYAYVLERSAVPPTAESYMGLVAGDIDVDEEALEAALPPEKRTAIRHSFSDGMAAVIDARFPDLAEYLDREPLKELCVNLNKVDRDGLIAGLVGEGFEARPGALATSVISEDNARYSKAVKEGLAHVQDGSSQFVAGRAASLGSNILDYCAGSGGKSLAMASITKGQARLSAYDKDAKKLDALRERAGKHGLCINVLDAAPTSPSASPFDVVLVDAPCSGVGAARRNPETKYITDLGRYPPVQSEILSQAAGNVRPGGYLVYSVCTFLPQETEDVIARFVAAGGFSLMPPKDAGLPESGLTHMVVPGGDVLYVAVLRKDG